MIKDLIKHRTPNYDASGEDNLTEVASGTALIPKSLPLGKSIPQKR
jgi:hypothetical protein